MKIINKAVILSLIFVLVTGIFAGCSSIPSSIGTAKKNGASVDIPTSYYLFNAYMSHANLEYQAAQYKTDLKTMFESSGNSSVDYAAQYDDKIKDQTTTLFMGIKKFDELKLKFTSEEAKEAASFYDNLVSNFGNEAVVSRIRTQMRMSDTKFREFLKEYYKNIVLFRRYFAEGGEYEIKEDALKETFTNEYYRVKHILIKYPEGEDKKPIKDAANAEYIKAKEKAENVLKKAKAGEDFKKLASENTADNPGPADGTYSYSNGFVSESYGYTFTSGSMDENFYNKAKEMKVGDIDIVESTHGWHIMKKYDVNEVPDIFNNLKNDLSSKVSSKKQKELNETWAKDYEFKFNDSLLNKYSIKKLKNVLS